MTIETNPRPLGQLTDAQNVKLSRFCVDEGVLPEELYFLFIGSARMQRDFMGANGIDRRQIINALRPDALRGRRGPIVTIITGEQYKLVDRAVQEAIRVAMLVNSAREFPNLEFVIS